MACIFPKQEWTIEIQLDDHPESDSVIVFCLNVENGIINGEGSELPTGGEPVKLSPVTGRSLPLPELGSELEATLMALIFTRGTSKVVLSGHTFRTGGPTGVNNFFGRFSAFTTGTTDGDGDTGTGTGTQT